MDNNELIPYGIFDDENILNNVFYMTEGEVNKDKEARPDIRYISMAGFDMSLITVFDTVKYSDETGEFTVIRDEELYSASMAEQLRDRRRSLLSAFDLWEKAVVRRTRRRLRGDNAMVSRYS